MGDMTNPTPTPAPAPTPQVDVFGTPIRIGDRVDIISLFITGQTGPVTGTGTIVGFSGYVQPVQVLVDDPEDPTMELEFLTTDIRKSVGR